MAKETGEDEDGRTLRTKRSRQAVVDAALALTAEGEAQPTARLLAERSGVSLSTIFRLYDDLEALYAEVVEAQRERIVGLIEPFSPEDPLTERVDALVGNRARIFELVGPVRRHGRSRASSAVVVREGRRELDAFLRRQVLDLFAAELHGTDPTGGRSEALDAITSWDTWSRLRHGQGLSVRRSKEAIAVAVLAVLGP